MKRAVYGSLLRVDFWQQYALFRLEMTNLAETDNTMEDHR